MLIRSSRPDAPSLPDREATPEALYLDRRQWLAGAAAAAWVAPAGLAQAQSEGLPALKAAPGPFGTDEKRTPFDAVTGYNNFYEFGLDKTDPARLAGRMRTRPWTVKVSGLVAKPRTLDLSDLIRGIGLEERVYRLRCVEAWSMVVPWVGFPLSTLIRRLEPQGSARYVQFETLADPAQMPGVRSPVLDWPYVEGLRMDEAMHPLTIMAVGLYGRVMPNQNGAPIRLVVPWKYGFKSIKSIVGISFTERQPRTSWNVSAPSEYGFYANVNPAVDHPRWSQARERRIGEFLRRDTLPFNGYAAQVAGLYRGMDLRRFY